MREFWETHPRGPEAKAVLETWYGIVRLAEWKSPADVKGVYADASILKRGRIVFNIGGNKFRLVAHINYRRRIVYVRFVGTHGEYDKVDAETV